MEEIWKGLSGIVENGENYEISNFGRIRSIDRITTFKDGRKKFEKGKILKPCKNTKGYLQIKLYKNGKYKTNRIHRLVALAFIPNPNNLYEINHKDECKENNNVNNLEWCDTSYNANYGTRTKRSIKKLKEKNHYDKIAKISAKVNGKSVIQINKETNKIVNKFDSLRKACEWIRENTKFIKAHHRTLSEHINNNEECYGYKWEYSKE